MKKRGLLRKGKQIKNPPRIVSAGFPDVSIMHKLTPAESMHETMLPERDLFR